MMTVRRRRRATSGVPAVTDADDHYADWAAVYSDNANWVYAMMFRRVGNRNDAMDLTSEVFLAALKPLRMTATVTEVRGYLRATTRTVLFAHWHRSMDHELASIDDVEDVPDSAEQSASTVQQRVRTLLTALPDNYRLILELRFLEGLSISDSASQMGVSVANAKVLQHRALRLAATINRENDIDR